MKLSSIYTISGDPGVTGFGDPHMKDNMKKKIHEKRFTSLKAITHYSGLVNVFSEVKPSEDDDENKHVL